MRIHIIKIKNLKGKAKATGNDYDMNIIEAILDDAGQQSICEFTLAKDEPIPKPGQYDFDFKPAVEGQSKRLFGVVANLRPAKPQASTGA